MRILVAFGRNALLRPGKSPEAAVQRRYAEAAADGLAAIAVDHELVIAHGSGPKGDGLGAESDGMVGQMFELALRNALPDRDVITVLIEVVVSSDDPAFAKPSEPIGPVYSRAEADRMARERGWVVGQDGDAYRRLVPSPEPRAVAELRSVRALIESGALVVCAGGGGIPVAVDGTGRMCDIEAVVDRDLTAALLARRLDADLLLMLTDVDAVHLDWGTERGRPLRLTDPQELRAMSFAPGSMGPKVEAACRFVEATGRRAAVGALVDAFQIVRGDAGTQVNPRDAGLAGA